MDLFITQQREINQQAHMNYNLTDNPIRQNVPKISSQTFYRLLRPKVFSNLLQVLPSKLEHSHLTLINCACTK